jgi:hypothetical protein
MLQSGGSDDNKEIYDNLIFALPPASAEHIAAVLGSPDPDLEKICIYHNVICRSFSRMHYKKIGGQRQPEQMTEIRSCCARLIYCEKLFVIRFENHSAQAKEDK